jgi:hypothetical protein
VKALGVPQYPSSGPFKATSKARESCRRTGSSLSEQSPSEIRPWREVRLRYSPPMHVTGVLAVEGGAPRRETASSCELQPDLHPAPAPPEGSSQGGEGAGDHHTGPGQRLDSTGDGRDRGGAPRRRPGESTRWGGEKDNMSPFVSVTLKCQ